MLARRAFNDYMPCRYTTLKDLSDRLDGTLCKYDGKIVFIRVESSVTPSLVVCDWPNCTKKIKVIKPDDPLLDISLLDMGYMNFFRAGKNHVLYPYRNPSKKYKQGTYSSYVYIKNISGDKHEVFSSSVLESQEFVDSMNGVFPSSLSVLKSRAVTELALSQDLAARVDDLGVLEFFWRCEKIAIWVPGQELHTQNDEYSWAVKKILGEYL